MQPDALVVDLDGIAVDDGRATGQILGMCARAKESDCRHQTTRKSAHLIVDRLVCYAQFSCLPRPIDGTGMSTRCGYWRSASRRV
jgi:hypothetical protein